jgi:hypothetical protein
MTTENPNEMEETSYVIASWTTLEIPKSSTFDTRNTEDGRTWLSIIRPMTRSKQSGFLHGIFGRIIESPQTVWLVTGTKADPRNDISQWAVSQWNIANRSSGWESSEALEKFEASSTWSTQRELMASMSMTPPKTIHCVFSGAWWDRLTPHTGVTDISFPASSTEEVRTKVQNFKGLEYPFPPSDTEPKAYNGSGVRGWIRETLEMRGEAVITLRVFDHWMSEVMEQEFKTKVSTVEGETEILVYERYVRDLKGLGMMGIKEQHCKFTHIPHTFY